MPFSFQKMNSRPSDGASILSLIPITARVHALQQVWHY